MAASDPFSSYTRHVNPPLGRFLAVSERDWRLVSAEGCTLTTDAGETFDDWMAGFGATSFGHRPAFVAEAIARHLERPVPNLYPEALNPFAGALASALVKAAGPRFETCFLANSGAEAVEAALKAALLATGRSRIAYASGGYHGTTLGALACMARGAYRDPFEAVLSERFVEVPFGDAEALERALARDDVAAFMLEPIQVEAGVRVAAPEYLAAARALCDRHGSLLVLDEVQTGLGRTGTLFAFQQAGVEPDIFALGKALGGGLVPVSAAVMGEGIWQRAYGGVLRTEIHNSTFGGNALACAVGLAALERASEPSFLAQVAARGAGLERRLQAALGERPSVQRITMVGLLGGVALRDVSDPWATWSSLGLPELDRQAVSGALVVRQLARHRILAHLCGHDWSTVRIEPPLIVDEERCARFVEALVASVDWLERNGFA
jgi:putrescine aminotransferase